MTSAPTPPKSSSAAIREALGKQLPGAVTGTPAAAPAPIYATRPRKPRPTRRVSAITSLPVFAYAPARRTAIAGERPEDPRGVDVPGPVVARETPAVYATRGAEAIIAKLKKLGVTFMVTPDRTNVVPLTEAGGMTFELRDALLCVWPLIRGHLTAQQLRCSFCDAEAVDVALGGAGMCELHAVETFAP